MIRWIKRIGDSMISICPNCGAKDVILCYYCVLDVVLAKKAFLKTSIYTDTPKNNPSLRFV